MSDTPETPLQPKHPPYHVRPSQSNLSSLHTASTLVINCVDFRLRDEVARFLSRTMHLDDQYDEIALPGASLAFVTKAKPHWAQTIDDVIEILQTLHHIKRVLFIDHMECGAYRALLGDTMKDKAEEKKAHIHTLHQAREKMAQLFPSLEVSTWLLDLNGDIVEYVPYGQAEE